MGIILYKILDLSFFITAILTPILIIVQAIRGYHRLKLDKVEYKYRAVVALGIWFVPTVVFMVLKFMLIILMGEAIALEPALDPYPSLFYVGLHLIYFSGCYWLVYWESRIKLP